MIEIIKNILQSKFDSSQLISIWNRYCDSLNNYDNLAGEKVRIHHMANFNSYFRLCDAEEMVKTAKNSNIKFDDEYFTYDEQADIVRTFSKLMGSPSPFNINLLAKWYLDNKGELFPNSEFRIPKETILKEYLKKKNFLNDDEIKKLLS